MRTLNYVNYEWNPLSESWDGSFNETLTACPKIKATIEFSESGMLSSVKRHYRWGKMKILYRRYLFFPQNHRSNKTLKSRAWEADYSTEVISVSMSSCTSLLFEFRISGHLGFSSNTKISPSSVLLMVLKFQRIAISYNSLLTELRP